MVNGVNGENTPLVLKPAALETKSEYAPVLILFHLEEVIHVADLQHKQEPVTIMHVQVHIFNTRLQLR